MDRRRRHVAIVSAFAAMLLGGVLLTAFGGTPSLRPRPERVMFLGDNGRIIRVHVGDVIDLRLGDPVPGETWRFSSNSPAVRMTPVYTASMPLACPPTPGATVRETVSAGGAAVLAAAPAPGTTSSCTPQQLVTVRLVRLTMTAPGVATVKGWRVRAGSAASLTPPSLPDFVFVILVER